MANFLTVGTLSAILSLGFLMDEIYGYTKEVLIEQVNAYRNQISDIDFKSFYNLEKFSEDPLKAWNLIPKMNIHIKYKGERQFTSYEAWHHLDEPRSITDLRVYNGKVSKQYTIDDKTGYVISEREEYVAQHNYAYKVLMFPTHPSNEINPFTDLIETLKSKKSKILSGKGRLFDTETIVLNYDKGKMKIWLDVEHLGLVRKVEIRSREDGPLLKRDTIPILHNVNGVFFPGKVVREMYMSESNPENMWNTLVWRWTLDVTKDTLKINSGIEDKDFDFEFPPGTLVTDVIADINYVVGVPGLYRPNALDEMLDISSCEPGAVPNTIETITNNPPVSPPDGNIESVQDKQHFVNDTPSPSAVEEPAVVGQQGSGSYQKWLYLGIVISIAIIVLGMFKRKRSVAS